MTDQRVKVMVQQIKDSHTFTKEFEVVIKGLDGDEGVGVKPKVAPAVQQWYGKEGQSSITSDTVLRRVILALIRLQPSISQTLQPWIEPAQVTSRLKNESNLKKLENKGYG